MTIDQNGKYPVIKSGNRELVIMEIKEHLVITDARELGKPIKYKKGSITFRTAKGMKTGAAIKDLVEKAKPSTTEAVIIDLS